MNSTFVRLFSVLYLGAFFLSLYVIAFIASCKPAAKNQDAKVKQTLGEICLSWKASNAQGESRLVMLDNDGAPLGKDFDIPCDAPIVVFVHGWVFDGKNRTLFSHTKKWREAGYITLAFEWNAFGPDPLQIYSAGSVKAGKDFAKMLLEFRDQLTEKYRGFVHLVGHSFGAKVALDSAVISGCYIGREHELRRALQSSLTKKKAESEKPGVALETEEEQKLAQLSEKLKPLGGISADKTLFSYAAHNKCVEISRVTLLDPALLILEFSKT